MRRYVLLRVLRLSLLLLLPLLGCSREQAANSAPTAKDQSIAIRVGPVEARDVMRRVEVVGTLEQTRTRLGALDGEEEPRTLSRLDSKSAVSLLVQKQSGTNTVAVVERVKARLQEITTRFPSVW
ncbi:MAG: efflux RND transporter permease subunit [Candidatus Methylomirabilis oxyfera]|nr:efflux RND transporter permease subunit [Candidatus Methylomirabilis oxyfera]